MTTTTHDPLAAYESGDLMDGEALRALADEYRALDAALSPLEARKKALRGALERITLRLGGKAQAGGYDLAYTQGGESVSYDAKQLDSIGSEMLATGDMELIRYAGRIAQARRVTPRAASLRVTVAKGGKA